MKIAVLIAMSLMLVPLLAIPRLFLERKKLEGNERRPLYMFESLAGIALAIGVGLVLRMI